MRSGKTANLPGSLRLVTLGGDGQSLFQTILLVLAMRMATSSESLYVSARQRQDWKGFSEIDPRHEHAPLPGSCPCRTRTIFLVSLKEAGRFVSVGSLRKQLFVILPDGSSGFITFL